MRTSRNSPAQASTRIAKMQPAKTATAGVWTNFTMRSAAAGVMGASAAIRSAQAYQLATRKGETWGR